MEKYNLLYIMGENPEVRIIKDESLTEFRKKNPSLETVSFGDFYTEIPLVKFPKVMYNSFDNDEKRKIKILPSSKYNSNIHNEEGNLYLIRENDGIRLNFPMKGTEKLIPGFEYQLLSIIATQDLLSNKKEGSFQQYLDSMTFDSNQIENINKEVDIKTLERELGKQINWELENRNRQYDALLNELSCTGRYN